MKNFKLTLLFVVLSTILKAQVSYTEVYDDPLNYKRLFITIHPFNMDFATPSSLRMGVSAEFNLNKLLSFSAEVDRSVLGPFPLEGALKKPTFSAEGGLVFNYFAKVVKGKVQYKWREFKHIYRLTVDGKVLRTAGLRGGAFAFGSAKDLGFYKTYYNTAGIYAGIIFGATRNKSISAKDVEMRHTDKETKGVFYIDALYAPVISYSDLTDYNHVDATTRNLSPDVNLDTLVTKNHFGVRMGWMKTERYPIPVKYGFEVGLRPGLQKNFFFLVKIAFSFGLIEQKTVTPE